MMVNWIKKIFARISQAKLFIRYRGEDDNWIFSKVGFSPNYLGCKCNENMDWYLEGESAVDISSVDELCNWLLGCKYVGQQDNEKKAQAWQHPLDFEKFKAGNCVGSSLWAWRKLCELSIKTEFFLGEWEPVDERSQHAWVVFELNEKKYLIDTVSKDRDKMLYLLDNISKVYIPWMSIDNKLKYRLYGGYCSALKKENNWNF